MVTLLRSTPYPIILYNPPIHTHITYTRYGSSIGRVKTLEEYSRDRELNLQAFLQVSWPFCSGYWIGFAEAYWLIAMTFQVWLCICLIYWSFGSLRVYIYIMRIYVLYLTVIHNYNPCQHNRTVSKPKLKLESTTGKCSSSHFNTRDIIMSINPV